MIDGLRQEISSFLKAKETTAADARQMAALQIACHFDLAEALRAEPAKRAQIASRLRRMIERERQRGARKHWSYDLNRHIALKQALDRLCPADPDRVAANSNKNQESRKRKRRQTAPREQMVFGKVQTGQSGI